MRFCTCSNNSSFDYVTKRHQWYFRCFQTISMRLSSGLYCGKCISTRRCSNRHPSNFRGRCCDGYGHCQTPPGLTESVSHDVLRPIKSTTASLLTGLSCRSCQTMTGSVVQDVGHVGSHPWCAGIRRVGLAYGRPNALHGRYYAEAAPGQVEQARLAHPHRCSSALVASLRGLELVGAAFFFNGSPRLFSPLAKQPRLNGRVSGGRSSKAGSICAKVHGAARAMASAATSSSAVNFAGTPEGRSKNPPAHRCTKPSPNYKESAASLRGCPLLWQTDALCRAQ